MAQARTSQKSPTDIDSQSLRLRNAEADALFFSIGEGAITTDERGNIARINKVALDILGFKAKDVLGKWYPETIVAEDETGRVISNIDRPITEAILSGKPVFQRVYYRKKDGNRIPVALTVSPLILNDEPFGTIEVFRDITKEVELENAKDEFISIASHQLRTPATVVKQYMGMLIEGYVGELTKEQSEMLQKAYAYNDTQLHIITDLLKVAQADANKITAVRKEIDFMELLRDIVASQTAKYQERGLTLTCEADQVSARCTVDPLHMRMVFENLLTNARKYSPDNSNVKVLVHVADDHLTITVADEGIGIAERDIPRLFQKFSRIHNPHSSASGTGLGLYWAKKLVDLHDGTITISSKLNKGTTFTVTIPRNHS